MVDVAGADDTAKGQAKLTNIIVALQDADAKAIPLGTIAAGLP